MEAFPKYKTGDTILSDCYFHMPKDAEMIRIRGARKWYAPWKRYGDFVMINIRASIIGDDHDAFTRAQFESECG